MSFSGTRVTTDRPSLAAALVEAWRTWHEHEPLLSTGPSDTGPSADGDRTRVLADLRAAAPSRA